MRSVPCKVRCICRCVRAPPHWPVVREPFPTEFPRLFLSRICSAHRCRLAYQYNSSCHRHTPHARTYRERERHTHRRKAKPAFTNLALRANLLQKLSTPDSASWWTAAATPACAGGKPGGAQPHHKTFSDRPGHSGRVVLAVRPYNIFASLNVRRRTRPTPCRWSSTSWPTTQS